LEEKRVYVASDDPNILDECKQKFPGFFFINELFVFKRDQTILLKRGVIVFGKDHIILKSANIPYIC
jgi:hypothetical protein